MFLRSRPVLYENTSLYIRYLIKGTKIPNEHSVWALIEKFQRVEAKESLNFFHMQHAPLNPIFVNHRQGSRNKEPPWP